MAGTPHDTATAEDAPKYRARLVASGSGWTAHEVFCTAGPHDRAFEERHSSFCIAAIMGGMFRYRSSTGTALMAPGALLLGNPGHCFECGHEHSTGDRCMSFHFAPDYFEDVIAAVPGAHRSEFRLPQLPPAPGFTPLLAEIEAGLDGRDALWIEEFALRLAGEVFAALNDPAVLRSPTANDLKRVSRALQFIEAHAGEAIRLADIASVACMSPYHFLRTFTRVVGLTPHQFILQTRLRRAASRIRAADAPISAAAFEAGFNDLSTFNRTFKAVLGVSPVGFRNAGDFHSPRSV